MVTLLVGFPGSGKTYFAIDKIYNILIGNDTQFKGIEYIYTNINAVKFDYFPNSNIQFKKFNIDDFYKYLTHLYLIYDTNKNSDNIDDLLIQYSKEKEYYNSYFVFDECHDFFTPQDKVKVFWLTYHRHIHHEILLITQNKSLIHSKYRAIPEIFIEAQPISKKILDKTLAYKKYASFSMRKSEMFERFTIKKNDDVFKLYQSGNTSKQKSILHKFLLIIILGFLLTIFLFYRVFTFFNEAEEIQQTEKIEEQIEISSSDPKNINIQSNNNPLIESFNLTNHKVIKIKYFQNKGYLIFNNFYSSQHFNKFLHSTNSKVISSYLITNRSYIVRNIYLYTNDESLKQFFAFDDKKSNSQNTNTLNDLVNNTELLQ
jgi:zona occludens toxin